MSKGIFCPVCGGKVDENGVCNVCGTEIVTEDDTYWEDDESNDNEDEDYDDYEDRRPVRRRGSYDTDEETRRPSFKHEVKYTAKDDKFWYRPMTFVNWFETYLLQCIPVVNIVLLLVWSVAPKVQPSKKSWARYRLLNWLLIILLIVFFGKAILGFVTRVSNKLNETVNTVETVVDTVNTVIPNTNQMQPVYQEPNIQQPVNNQEPVNNNQIIYPTIPVTP